MFHWSNVHSSGHVYVLSCLCERLLCTSSRMAVSSMFRARCCCRALMFGVLGCGRLVLSYGCSQHHCHGIQHSVSRQCQPQCCHQQCCNTSNHPIKQHNRAESKPSLVSMQQQSMLIPGNQWGGHSMRKQSCAHGKMLQ
jgi:hypothetical protein